MDLQGFKDALNIQKGRNKVPTQQEYDAILDAVIDPIQNLPFKNKRELDHVRALAHQALVKERRNQTQKITNRWKEVFKTIKEENDVWQQALAASYKSAHTDLDDWWMDMIEGLQK